MTFYDFPHFCNDQREFGRYLSILNETGLYNLDQRSSSSTSFHVFHVHPGKIKFIKMYLKFLFSGFQFFDHILLQGPKTEALNVRKSYRDFVILWP